VAYPLCWEKAVLEGRGFKPSFLIRKKEEGRRKRGRLGDGKRGRIFSQLGIRN
jgi:hypothetical protein